MLQKPSPTEAFPIKNKDDSTISSIFSADPKAEQSQKSIGQVKSTKDSYWSWKEQQIYLSILKEHMPMVTSTEYRRKHRIFKKISLSLRTRTAVQVKSHHQKLEERLKTVPKIIEYLQRWLEDTEDHCQVPQEAQKSVLTNRKGKLMIDACMQTDPPFCHEIFFQPEYLENYIQSLISFKQQFFIGQ